MNVNVNATTLGSLQQSLQIKIGRTTASTGCRWSWESSEQCDAYSFRHLRRCNL